MQVITIMIDNSRDIRTMIKILMGALKGVNSKFERNHHMPSTAHVINFYIQDSLKALDIPQALTIKEATEIVDDES